MTDILVLFIPNSNDEKTFIDIISSMPDVNFIPFSNRDPFYTLLWDNNKLFVRKRRDHSYGLKYKKLLSDDAAALSLLPKEAIKEFLFSL